MKKIAPVIAALIIVGGASFYGGLKYADSKNPSSAGSASNRQNFSNLTPEQRQQRFGQMGAGAGRTDAGARQGGANFVSGEIIAKDDKSITVKLRDGGSKIVFYSGSTNIEKFASGATNDLEVGKSIMVNGSANADGSVTAQSIQLRPEIIAPPAK